jgi:DNA-binding transcriptional regulator GbsR (MarR family)
MPESDDPIRERFIHEVGELAAGLGLSRSVGQIYALLYMSPEPVSLTGIAEACRMSKGNASTFVRELERWEAARKVCVPGERQDFYAANRDVAGIVMDRLQQGMGRRLDSVDRVIDQAREEIEEAEPDNGEFYRERLEDIEALTSRLRSVVENMEAVYGVVRRLL